MKIDKHRVSAYLSGNFSPYFQSSSKIQFIIEVNALFNFSFDKFELIERHTNTLQSFFSETLNLLKDESKILILCKKLEVPKDVSEALKYDIIINNK